MKKILCHIVIFSLLVIAPVSFSTAKIPNFDIPATKTNQLHESRKVVIGIIHKILIKPVLAEAVCYRHNFVQFKLIPAFDRSLENMHGRSPPKISLVVKPVV